MIDTKKFYDELIDLWNNFYNTDEVYDIIFVEDDYIEVKCENKKVANQFADYIMVYYNAMICYDFRKGNGCYQFSISPSLMIRESKKSSRKSIKESNRTKLDIIKDMVDLAYDVKRQSKIDKDSYFGNQPNSVINAKDDKVYEKFVDLAEKLKLHGWNQFIDYAYDLIDEYENVIEESKKSARKSIKESSDVAEKISSEIDKSYWIDKLIDDLNRHYESMEKAWLKNLDKLSDEDILGIIDDCIGKSKTLVGKSEMLKNKMIDDLSKAYDDYIDDIDRQIRIGKSEEEIKDMIETTLKNDIKMYLKLAYNNKASSNYFMVKFAEDNLI